MGLLDHEVEHQWHQGLQRGMHPSTMNKHFCPLLSANLNHEAQKLVETGHLQLKQKRTPHKQKVTYALRQTKCITMHRFEGCG